MRLITHTDLDGVFCAALLCSVEQIDEVKFIDPGTIQAGTMRITKNDILSDLPYDSRAGLWFDHHASSQPKAGQKFEGAFALAPSGARVIFDYFENPFLEKYRPALEEVDKIDSGQVPLEQARAPTGWFLLSNTLETDAPKEEDDRYRRHVIALIRKNPDIAAILADGRVAARTKNVQAQLAKFGQILREHTVLVGQVAYSDLRARPDLPRGNNFLVYALFPQARTSVRLMPQKEGDDLLKISVGHNIYGKKSAFDVGAAMKRIGGGGHAAVGGASVPGAEAEKIARKLVDEINEFLKKEEET
ncbi:Uncharacterised protein [uncultured archaeon]|nr:Uncharacterised protein [uncultured archaeon]